MSEIAANSMVNARNVDGTLSFAVMHLHEMLMKFKRSYYDAWGIERPPE